MTATHAAPVAAEVATSQLALGTAANLLYGVGPTWTGDAASLFAPPSSATAPVDVAPTGTPVDWGFPALTLHADASSLLSTLYAYDVAASFEDTGVFSVPAGPLAIGDADSAAALAAAGAYVGVDLTKPGESYMLVRLTRTTGTAQHPSIAQFGDQDRDTYLTPAARDAFQSLATAAGVADQNLIGDMQLTAEQAASYLAALYEYGTHFVSSLTVGDVIFQVFAYPADRFAQLQAAFVHDQDAGGQVTGLTALNYEYYTSPVVTAPSTGYGYASQTGTIVAFSGDPELATTLAAKAWDDSRYVGGPSIFEAFSTANSVGRLLEKFQLDVPIAIGFAPISDLVPQAFQATTLTRLLKGALLQKYAAGVTVSFAPLRTIAWNTLFPQDQASWLSTIATPTIDVYQELVDLASVQLINTDVVQSFTIASMALLIGTSTPVPVPGASLTIASYIIDTTANTTIPTIQIAPGTFDHLSISVGAMYGALTVAASDGSRHDVLLDGFRFATGPVDATTHRTTVQLAGDVVSPPDGDALTALTRDLQFSLMTAESRMWGRSASQDAVQEITVGYLGWLAGLVPADCDDEDLVAMAAQAEYLAKAALNLGGYGVPVPYLTFESYKDYVGSMVDVADALSDQIRDYQGQIAQAKQAELTAKTAAEINDNIKATGGLLTKYFGVLAQNQTDIAGYYGSIVDQKRQEYAKTITNIAQLQQGLKDQQAVVNASVESFEQALADWETEQVIKMCFQVAQDVFTVGVAFAIPAADISAVKMLGETAQKIQKVMTILAALAKLESNLETSIRSLAGVQRTMQMFGGPIDLPTPLEWQEFSVNMNASLATVPSDLAGPKADLVAAFTILSLRGQALVTAQAKQAQILTDIYFNERQQNINAAQAKRMSDLTTALNLGNTSGPDLPGIDLIGLTSEVQGPLQQVLASLAKTLLLQDGAVQYSYLGEPATIQKFDLVSLKQVMMLQQGNIINALNMLNPPPLPVSNPIEYKITGVPTSAVTGGNVFTFTIQPSATEFWKYAMVRVNKVLLSVDGISGSTGGEYLAALTFVGEPFMDRDAQRNPIEFNTVDRHFGPYDYTIATGAPQFGDGTGTIAANITDVTPFGTWQVNLPPTSTNNGLTFDGPTVDIVLSFQITALLVDTPQSVLRARAARAGMLAAADGGTPGTALSDLLTNMYQAQAVMKGWDAVFNVLEDPVNTFMTQQYNEKYKGQSMVVEFGFCTGPFPFQGQWVGSYNKFHIVLGGPLMQFEQNNGAFVTVTQVITAADSQFGSKTVTQDWNPATASIDDPGVDWGAQTAIDVSNGPTIQGSVALTKVQGLVEPKVTGGTTQSVVLDFAQGSFTANQLKVGTDNAALNNELTNWFVTNPIEYIVNTVDFSDIPNLPVALTPTKFMLNVLATNSGKTILQQFITTNGAQQSNLTINVNEPIPDSYDCSLMVGTEIMFQSIFVQSFNSSLSAIRVAPDDPGNDYTAWAAHISQGTVTGTINFPNDNQTQYRIDANGNSLTWDISGLQFLRTQMLAIALNYVTTKTQSFQARQWISGNQYSPGQWGSWQDYSVDVNVVLTGNYPIQIQNSGAYAGKNQTIQLINQPPDINISNTTLHPDGPCQCTDADLQIAVKNELAKDVPGALQAQMANVSFTPISLFALESLLFPGGSLITMDGAYVPGDLVVVGHFTATS